MTTSTKTVMKALQFASTGSYEDAKIVEIPTPTIQADDDVLVKVVCAAIDTALDELVNNGSLAFALHSKRAPLYLGWHYSGVIEAMGTGGGSISSSSSAPSTDNAEPSRRLLKKGDEVWGFLPYDGSTTQGSLSEYIVVKRQECALKPASVSHEVAAAAATETITALQAMRDCGGLNDQNNKNSNNKKEEETKEGDGHSVLILGAGGSVGSVAVRIAKLLGARNVAAVCSTKDVERVKALGADVVIDRKLIKEDPLEALKKNGLFFDVIFDTPGARGAHECFGNFHPQHGGTYVSTLPNWGLLWGFLLSLFSWNKKVRMVHAMSKEEDLELIGKWLDSSSKMTNDRSDSDGLKIEVDSTFKVCDIKAAMDKYHGPKSGRVVIQVEEGWN